MMNSNNDTIYDSVRMLLTKALDGTIVPDESSRLDALLSGNAEARHYYLELIHLHLGLRRISEKKAVAECRDKDNILDQRLWEELARSELMAEPVEVALPKPSRKSSTVTQVPVKPMPLSERVNKWAFYTALVSTAAMLCVVCYLLLLPPVPPIVATLTDAMQCSWADTGKTIAAGQDVRAEPHQLLSGVLSVRFDSGVDVIIEGPAEFTPLSTNKLFLASGKAFAQVPDTAIGFTIDTPQSSVVDLGTAFGVSVIPDRGSEVHVHDGKVNLVVGQTGNTRQSEFVTMHQARRVSPDSDRIVSTEFKRYLFIQEFASKEDRISYGPPICLASFVAGGDGRTPGDQPSGIDPATGHIHQTVHEELGRTGSGTYHTVAQRAFVDGVFVPNGPSVVSSAGHTFEGFPATTGTFWSDITASPVFNYTATNEDGEILYRRQFIATLDSTSDVNMESAKPIILMHTNSGITFDLNKIRDGFKNAEITVFRADCGVTKNAMVKMRHDFWVLLDGQQVFHYSQAANDDTAQTIRIPIRPDQSFLTLATTDGGDNTSYDWCIFENAVLELAPKGLQ